MRGSLFVNDDPVRAGARLVRLGLRTGLAGRALSRGAPQALRLVLRHGLDVRDVHALHAALTPDRLCLADERTAMSFREADHAINRLAHGLRRRFAVGPGVPLVLMTENRVEYLLAWFASFRLRARVVHAPWQSGPDELAWLVSHSGARAALVSEASREAGRAVAARHDGGLALVDADEGAGAVPFAALAEQGDDAFPSAPVRAPGRRRPAPTDGGNVVYTPGTTGRPKGALRDFAHYGVTELFRILERLPLASDDRHLLVAPLHHSAGQVFTLLQAALGATTWLRRRFEAEDTLRALSRLGIHSVFLVPTMLRRLLDLPAEVQARHPLPALKAVVSGAAPFPEPLRRRAAERFGARRIFDFYGATELGWVTLIDGEEMRARPGSVGRVLPGQALLILDDAGRPQPPGRVGRVFVRNAQVMSGYLKDAEATAASRHAGWSTVDDLGRLDADGYLYLVGRARDLVITGGVNVYPAAVEARILEHPAVAEVAVLGVPDEAWGERLVAVVVPARDDLDLEALAAWLRTKGAGYEVPKQWAVAERLPRTPTGKVRTRDLARRFGGEAP